MQSSSDERVQLALSTNAFAGRVRDTALDVRCCFCLCLDLAEGEVSLEIKGCNRQAGWVLLHLKAVEQELDSACRLGHFLPLPPLQEPAADAAAGGGKKGSAEYIQSPAPYIYTTMILKI